MTENKNRISAKKNRNFKDGVFTDLFYADETAKQNLLSLYNAMHDASYTDLEIIRKVRLEDVLFMNMKNDIAFTVDNREIILGEQQSTISHNMPLRFLMYIGREYEKLVENEDRYKRSLVHVPTPEFIVFYNGEEDAPLEETLRLSDAYLTKNAEVNLELSVRVININTCKKHRLLKDCQILKEYSEFIDIARKYKGSEENLTEAVKECIEKGILKSYLQRKGSEVVNMLMATYDYDTDIRVNRKEAREEGWIEGLSEGRKEGLSEGRKEGLSEGRKEGLSEGMKKGQETGILESIRNLMDTLQLSAEQAMAALKIPEKDRVKYYRQL